MDPTQWTNASKAQVSSVITAGIALAAAFGLELSAEQTAMLVAFVEVCWVTFVGLTYKNSSRRIPDELPADPMQMKVNAVAAGHLESPPKERPDLLARQPAVPRGIPKGDLDSEEPL